MKFFAKTALVSLLLSANLSWAHNYDHAQGAIFEQPYITRVPLSQFYTTGADTTLLEPYLDWQWPAETLAHDEVTRVKGALVIRRANQPNLTLQDFATDELDGDAQTFQYLQSTDTYHLIGVLFGHDQPAFLLVSKTGDTLYFVDTHE